MGLEMGEDPLVWLCACACACVWVCVGVCGCVCVCGVWSSLTTLEAIKL